MVKSCIAAVLFGISIQTSLPSLAQQTAPAPSGQADSQQAVTPAQAFALVTENAQKGDPRAMLTLGAFYEQGVGVPRNYIFAMQWYQKAADAGLAEGQYNLGVCYEIGMGNAGDLKKAVQFFEKAADQGLTPAMHKLASMYFSGTGVSQSNSRGLAWLNKASESGDPDAANRLGVIYQQGLLAQKKDEKKAFEYFMKAANSGYLEAIKNLAVINKDGLGRRKDPAMALQWYLIALKGGYRAGDLQPVITTLKENLSAAQVEKAEKNADDWIKTFQAKNLNASSR